MRLVSLIVHMAALTLRSLKLIQGTMDQIHQIVSISWVQPRVLNVEQISDLGGRMSGWAHQITDMGQAVEVHAGEMAA